jgi:hypothetical protein
MCLLKQSPLRPAAGCRDLFQTLLPGDAAPDRIEETLDFAAAYEQVPGQFGNFLADFVATEAPYRQGPAPPTDKPPYMQDTKARVEEMLRRAEELVRLGKDWCVDPTVRGGSIPKLPTHLRITP